MWWQTRKRISESAKPRLRSRRASKRHWTNEAEIRRRGDCPSCVFRFRRYSGHGWTRHWLDPVANDPNVWSGRAVQEVFVDPADAVLHQCIRPLIGALCSGLIMDISAPAFSLPDRPQRTIRVTSVRMRREDRASIVVSSSRGPRRVVAAAGRGLGRSEMSTR